MTNTKKISELTELSTKSNADLLVIVDVDDLTDGASGTTKKIQAVNLVGAGGLGDVVGPASSVDNRVATFDLTTGKIIQDSGWLISELLNRGNHTFTQLLSTISDVNASPTEVNYSVGVTSAIQTQLNAKLTDVVDDTTPQWGGNNDRNNKSITSLETAGEALVFLNLCVLNASDKYVKTDASAEATAKGHLIMANATISSDVIGEFVEYGEMTTTGLTAGATYYMSETAGAITATAPTTSGSIVRIIGYAKSTTVLFFIPDGTYVEVA